MTIICLFTCVLICSEINHQHSAQARGVNGIPTSTNDTQRVLPQVTLLPTTPTVSLNWYITVYQSERDGNWEIYRSTGMGGGQVNLTSYPASDTNPAVSHDGKRVAFVSDRNGQSHIFTMNITGSGVVALTQIRGWDGDPAWSPDDSQIAFITNRDDLDNNLLNEIYVMNADGSAQTRLTTSDADDRSPTWSPDGKQIAWIQMYGSAGILWIMNADGSNQHAITPMLEGLGHLSWAPVSDRIAFDYDAVGGGKNEIAIINADGSDLHTIYDPGELAGYCRQNVLMGAWSADEKWLVCTHWKYVLVEEKYVPYYYIETMYLGNAEQMQSIPSNVITSSGKDMYPDWANLDDDPPISQVHSLPTFSRAAGFMISYSGIDVGPSGVYGYAIQYRMGSDGDWKDLFTGIALTAHDLPFSSSTCDTVYFRTAAIDGASNWEPWPPGDGDAWTHLFHSLLNGTVKDNRAYPIPEAQLVLTPTAWEDNLKGEIGGNYLAHLPTRGGYTLNASQPGYRPIENLNRSVVEDTTIDLYLPPIENAFQNGDFEVGATGWITSGSLPLRIQDTYSGAKAAVISQACTPPCLAEVESPHPANLYSNPSIAADGLGNVHVVWRAGTYFELNYSMRDPQGNWSPIEILEDSESTHHTDEYQTAITVDKQNTIHLVAIGVAGLMYYRKPAGGNWSEPEILEGGRYPSITVDDQGVVYLSYFNFHQIVYRKRLISGSWIPARTIDDQNTYSATISDIAIGPDGIVHFVYGPSDKVRYRELLPDGTLTDQVDLYGAGAPQIAVDSQNRLHVIIATGNAESARLVYLQRDPQGTWANPEVLSPGWTVAADLAVDKRDRVHVVVSLNQVDTIQYYYRDTRFGSFEHYSFPANWSGPQDVALALDSTSAISIVWADYDTLNYRTTARAQNGGAGFISQQISLPPNLNHPTLDFMYNLDAPAVWEQSAFNVTVTDDLTTTALLSTTADLGWSHFWADLSAWAGQSISVTFGLHQAVGDPYVQLSLDNISAGAWLTPVLQAVTPKQIGDISGSPAITITGDNFINPVKVRLNNITMTDVVLVDEHTLQITLPASLPPGVYNVWVTNPDGQAGVIPQGFQAGQFIYLPLILR
jgi:Tol biopolymer transport system component